MVSEPVPRAPRVWPPTRRAAVRAPGSRRGAAGAATGGATIGAAATDVRASGVGAVGSGAAATGAGAVATASVVGAAVAGAAGTVGVDGERNANAHTPRASVAAASPPVSSSARLRAGAAGGEATDAVPGAVLAAVSGSVLGAVPGAVLEAPAAVGESCASRAFSDIDPPGMPNRCARRVMRSFAMSSACW